LKEGEEKVFPELLMSEVITLMSGVGGRMQVWRPAGVLLQI